MLYYNNFLFSGQPGRVVGGSEAAPHQFPWLATVNCLGSDPELTNNDGRGWLCTGSFITESHVLTAGHCVYGCNGGFDIYAGAHDRTNVQNDPDALVIGVAPTDGLQYNRADYRPLLLRNDIAVIPLPAPLELNENVQLSCLPERRTEDIDYLEGQLATVTGWGKTSDAANGAPAVPNYARDRPIISNADCAQTYGSNIIDNIVCIDTSDRIGVCNGDSGGPLNLQTSTFGQYIQIGVASFVANAGCESGLPHGFARVTEHLDFISERTGLDL